MVQFATVVSHVSDGVALVPDSRNKLWVTCVNENGWLVAGGLGFQDDWNDVPRRQLGAG
jgi:hypothetical protein